MRGFYKTILIFFSPILVGVFLILVTLIMLSKYVIKNSNQYQFPQNNELIFLEILIFLSLLLIP